MQFRELKIMPHSPGHREVEVIYSDHADPTQATQLVRFRSVQPFQPRTSALVLHEGVLADLAEWLRTETARVNQVAD
jgi:hypothetical protein